MFGYFEGCASAPSGSYWAIGERTAQTTFWAAQEGVRVGIPIEDPSEPARDLLDDRVFEGALEFIDSGNVMWLHVSHDPAGWKVGSESQQARTESWAPLGRALFTPAQREGRLDANEREKSAISQAVERLRRELALCAKVCQRGGKVCREASWFSGVWQHPLSAEFGKVHELRTTQIDYCCFGRRFRRSTRFDSNDETVQRGTCVCPGVGVGGHLPHLPLKGLCPGKRGCRLARPILAEVYPVAVARWLGRCAAMFLCGRDEQGGLEPAAKHAFPRVSRDLVEKAFWECVRVGRWKFPEEIIFLKEARASVEMFCWAALLPALFGSRVLSLVDNEGVVLSLNRGRSANFSMLRLQRRICGYSFISRLRPRWRHLQGYRHPCDGPTRPSLLDSRARAQPHRLPTAHQCCSGPPGPCGH